MLKLATILDNPGEPVTETRYRDPALLHDMGYNGLVLYETTGLSGVDHPEQVTSAELHHWVNQRFDLVGQRVDRAMNAGMDVYLAYDVLSLNRELVRKRSADYCCESGTEALCPASPAALEASVQALAGLLDRFAGAAGVVLRFGDNDAHRLPHLIGNDIYQTHCRRCALLDRAQRIALVLDRFHDLVVMRLGKRLIARAWNVRPGGLHDSVDLCRAMLDRLPGSPEDDRFVLSFKFTHTDFWRYQRWNPCSLLWGRRPILYELECQREFEAKGAIPNWQVPLWCEGEPATAKGDEVSGLAAAADRVNLAGLWAWVRGGGWGGPFISNETWIDANVFAVPLLAEQPRQSTAELGHRWIVQQLGITEPKTARVLLDILEHSPPVIGQGLYIGPYARARTDPWNPNGGWIQDDLLDAEAAWAMIQALPESALDEAVREKHQAVERLSADRVALKRVIRPGNRSILEPLLHTLDYAEALLLALRDLVEGLVAYRRFAKSADLALAQSCRHCLFQAQNHWNHHTQRTASLPGTATAFREVQFWELTQKILGEVG